MAEHSNKEFSITINLLIFLTLISIVVISRIVIVEIFRINAFEDVDLISEINFNSDEDMQTTIDKAASIIEKNYEINIYYGSILKDIAPKVNANVLYDENTILQMLKRLASEFNKYPDGILSEIQSNGYKLSIYLIDSFNNSNVALANRTSNGYFNIFIAENDELEKSIHHEFYHIMEYYMKLQYGSDNIYQIWDSYNPSNFIYTNNTKNIDRLYVYGLDDIHELSFVSLYSKFSEEEDRAEIFSAMMLENEEYESNDKAKNIINKMDCIKYTLDLVFSSVEERSILGKI